MFNLKDWDFFNNNLIFFTTVLEQFAILDAFKITNLITTLYEGPLFFNYHTSIFLSNDDLSFLQQIIAITLIICVFLDTAFTFDKKEQAEGVWVDQKKTLIIFGFLVISKFLTIKIPPNGICYLCKKNKPEFFLYLNFKNYWLTNEENEPIKNPFFFNKQLNKFSLTSEHWFTSGLNQLETGHLCYNCMSSHGSSMYDEIKQHLFLYKKKSNDKYMRHKTTNQLTFIGTFIQRHINVYPVIYEGVNPVKWFYYWLIHNIYRIFF